MKTTPNHWLCHEGHLLLPQGYQDRTVNIFTAATPTSPVFNIARDQLAVEESLTQWFDRQLALLAEQLPEWRQQARETIWLGAQRLAGEVVYCDYRGHSAHIWQQQAVFNPANSQLLVFTMTHSARLQTADTCLFTALLRSFTFHPSAVTDAVR